MLLWSRRGESVEVDAIEPEDLRTLCRECIELHIDQRRLDILKVAEERFSCRCGCEVTRENAQAKGERYLLSGRLTIRLVTPERIEAHVKGDSGHIYRVIHDNGLWTCSCPAKQRCAHLVALKRVVSRPGVEVLG